MMNFSDEMIAKARSAQSKEELKALAAENGIKMSDEETETCFEQLAQYSANGELSDDELDNVSGGGCGKKKKDNTPASLFEIGDHVVYAPNPDYANPATITAKKYEDYHWSYTVMYLGKPGPGWLTESWLKKV